MRAHLVAGVGAAALALAAGAPAWAAPDKPAPDAPSPEKPSQVAPVRVQGRPEDTRAKLLHIMREVDGAKITVTRKSSTAILDQQALSAGDAPRELFARTPGVLLVEDPTPVKVDLAYRGLGDAKGGQGVLVLEDGLPISTDLVGDPTLSWLPFQQDVAQVQLVRGGSGLIYGPQAAAINFVTRRPQPGAPPSFTTEQIGGSDGLYSTFNEAEGSQGRVDGRADFGWRQSDGWRANGAWSAYEAGGWLGFHPAKGQIVWADVSLSGTDAGDPCLVGASLAKSDPGLSLTPDNHLWAGRWAATLGAEIDFAKGWRFEGKLRGAYQDLWRRAAEPQAAPGAPPPAFTTLQDEIWRSLDADLRLRKSWGHGNAFTFGVEAFQDSSPLRQWLSPDLTAGRNDHAGATPQLDEKRRASYASAFAENVFRLPHRMHVVPTVRIEHETVSIDETVKPQGLTRPPIDARSSRDTPLFGLGLGNDFGKDNETYVSVTQGWRPLRFFDLASPFTNTRPSGSADASRSLSWEAGVHGTPVKGLFYDASLFWITVKNRVETQALNVIDTVNVDTGDTRSRGFEGEIAYDFLAARPAGGDHLNAFADLTLLDARFVKSPLPGQVGRVPAYAPHVLAKAGLTWRAGDRWSLSLTGLSVGSQYFQDSDQPAGAGLFYVPAKVPSYVVFDLTGDLRLTRRIRLLAGVHNLGDERYWAYAQQTGVAPAPGRTAYAGLKVGF